MPTLPSRQRFALLVALCLGVFGGVIGYALSEEETLAGDPAKVEQIIGCPDGFVEKFVKLGDPNDANGDGIICVSDREIVDNVIEGDDDGRLKSTGHGNFFDGGKKLIQDISFSFHGIERGDAGAAKGQFEYHDQTGVGPDLTVHGDVLCLSVQKNIATFLGVVTRSNDLELPVDGFFMWMAIDNGEGIQDEPDQVSRLFALGPKEKPSCRERFSKLPTRPIVGGNVQVFQ